MYYKRWLLLFLVLSISACGLLGGEEGEETTTPTSAIPSPAATPTAANTPVATVPTGSSQPLTLNVWLVNEVSPYSDSPGAAILTDQLSSFDASHPDLNLDVEIKVTAGQGSTLSYLRTGRNVAPSILPDLIVLPVDQISTAASEGLIYGLDDLLTEELTADLFPAARTLSQFNNSFVGYPFVLTSLSHVAYDPAVFTDTVPITWSGLAEVGEASFVFPAGGVRGAELLLQFYLDAGGSLTNDSNQPALDVEPLTTALSLFSQSVSGDLTLLQSSNITTLADTWQVLQNGTANIAATDAIFYLRQLAEGTTSGFSAIPGLEAPLTPLVKGWAWAISTSDPARRALAGELLAWLASGPNLGEWSQKSQVLPASSAALRQWSDEDPYVLFLRQQLELAEPFPAQANTTIMTALNTAVFDVISLSETPQVAAEKAAAAITNP